MDSNRNHTYTARMDSIPTYTGSILAEHTLDEIELGGIGRVLAVTPNDWVNVLAVHRFERIFGRANCYQLPPHQDESRKKRHKYLHGRWLFNESTTHEILARRTTEGYTVKATLLTEEFDHAAYLARHGDSAIPLLIIDENKRLTLRTPEMDEPPQPGQTIVSLVRSL